MNKNKKIIMLTCDEHIDRRILLQADSLRKEGWEVTIISKSDIENYSSNNTISTKTNSLIYRLYRRLQAHSLFNPRLLKMMKTIGCLIFSSPADFQRRLFWPLVSQTKADVYVAHDLPMLPTAFACAMKQGAKLVYDSHELFAEQEFNALERWMWQSVERKYINKCDIVMTINASVAAELRKRYAIATVDVIQNAEKLVPIDDHGKLFHDKFNLNPEDKIVLYQGNMGATRNLDVLIRAMQYINSPHIHVVYLGSGSYSDELKQLTKTLELQDRVHFHEAVAQDKLLSYTASADVGIVPYLANCLNNQLCTPNKLFEYIAAGVPIIANDLIEIRKLTQAYHVGIVGDLQSPKYFATLIEDLVLNNEYLMKVKNSVLEARRKINWQVESQELINIYNRLI